MLSITQVLLCAAVLYVASATPILDLDVVDNLAVNPTAPCQQKETSFTIFTYQAKNWYEAFAACREKGLDLATIETEEEYQNVYAQIKGMNQSFWLSATDLAQNGSFVWMSTGHKVTYHKWHRNLDFYQPDNVLYRGEVEHCMKLHNLYDHEMNDNICSAHQYYICDDRNKINHETLEQKKKEFTVFTGNKVNWFEAITDCKAHGLRLATVESEEEHQDVVNTIKRQVPVTGRPTDFWLSGSDLGRKGTYTWMSSGRRVNYTAWHSGPQDEQPDYQDIYDPDYWWSGSDLGSYDTYNWMSSRRRVNYDAWHRGPQDKQPDHQVINGETEHCIVMTSTFDYEWNDRVCSSRNYYICDNQH